MSHIKHWSRPQLFDDMIEEVHKRVLEGRPPGDSVIRTVTDDMNLKDCKDITKWFQDRSFESTWYLNENGIEEIIVSWGIPRTIDRINDFFKRRICSTGGDADKIESNMAEYLFTVSHECMKNVCMIPVKYLEYICDTYSKNFNYGQFRHMLAMAESRYSLEVNVHTCEGSDGWSADYLSIKDCGGE